MSFSEPTKEELVDYMVSKGAVKSLAEEYYDDGLVRDYKTADNWIPEAKF